MSSVPSDSLRAARTDFNRERLRVVFGMAAVSIAAWAYLLRDLQAMRSGDMASMWMPPSGGGYWSAHDFISAFIMWSIMMIAMMTPTATPMALMFATVNRQRRQRGQSHVPTALFVGSYLLAWTMFSAVLTLMQWPLHVHALLSPMMESHSPMMAGAILIIAGIYQWTPWKDACLEQCRTPIGFLMTRWREGHRGALVMGFQHGWYCVGCCWALMSVMFAVGVMNMVWAALITLFVLAEKVLPVSPRLLRAVSGLGLCAWGAWMLIGIRGI